MFNHYHSEKLVNICSCRFDHAERAKADLCVCELINHAGIADYVRVMSYSDHYRTVCVCLTAGPISHFLGWVLSSLTVILVCVATNQTLFFSDHVYHSV